MKVRASLLAGFAALALCGAVRAQAPVWTVRGPLGKVVLFGSVHLLPKGLDWRPPALTEALSQADDIWFELPINQATDDAALSMTLRKGRLAPGDDLWRRLTPLQRTRLEAAAATVGIPPQALASMRPWFADLTLSLASDTQAGAQATDGVETQIQSGAPPNARRHAFETVVEQVGFLAGGSNAEQIAGLDETVREMTTDPDLYARTVQEWMAGDLGGLQRDDLDTLKAAAPATYRRLILDRNRRWARVLARVARGPGVTVVVVGAGHLIGPEGLPALLRAQGFVVDGP